MKDNVIKISDTKAFKDKKRVKIEESIDRTLEYLGFDINEARKVPFKYAEPGKDNDEIEKAIEKDLNRVLELTKKLLNDY